MKKIPTLRRHKGTDHAYARFDGQQRWFGRYEDSETHERFHRALAEWNAHGHQQADPGESLTVSEVVACYLEFAEGHYVRPDGTPTREVEHIAVAVEPLLKLYRSLPANEFGLRMLKTLRAQLVDRELGRKTINDRINRLVRMFRWAAVEELCEPRVFEAHPAPRAPCRGRPPPRPTDGIPMHHCVRSQN